MADAGDGVETSDLVKRGPSGVKSRFVMHLILLPNLAGGEVSATTKQGTFCLPLGMLIARTTAAPRSTSLLFELIAALDLRLHILVVLHVISQL